MRKFLSILLAVMMVLSTVSFAAPALAGTADTAVELPLDSLYEVEEDVDLAAIITDNTDHGELVFELNFDNLANGTAIANNAKLNTLGATLSTNIAKANDLYLVLSQYGSAVVENGALKAVKTGTGRWPQIQISAGNMNSLVDNGIIYMEADMMVDRTAAQTCTVNFGLTGYKEYLDGTSDAGTSAQAAVQTIYNVEDEKWYTLKGAYALNDDDGVNGLECVIFLPTYSASSAEADYYYIDNLRLYYKPFNAKVTLTSDADYLTLPETFEVPTTGITVSELVKDVEKAAVYYNITGVKVNGVEYGIDDTVAITKDCEVEVLSEENTEYTSEWIDKKYGILLFKSDFDNAPTGSFNILGTDNEDAAGFTATSEVNPYFSDYSSMEGTILLGDAYAPQNAEIVYDEVLESNVLKFTASQSYTGLMYSTPYNQRNKCDFINSPTGVLTIVHKLKAPVGATYRYNGWINNYPDTLTYNDGGDDSEDSKTSTDLGNGYSELVAVYNMVDGFHIDNFKIHLAGATAGDVAYFDDIEVFWKPATVNVEVADCDVKGVKVANKSLTDVATSISVSDFLALAGVDYSEVSELSYTFKGVSVASNPSEVYGLDDTLNMYENSTVNLVFEKVDMSDWSDEKGILLFDLDFSDAKAAEVFTPETNNKDYLLSSFNAKVNPYIAGTEKWAISSSGMDVVGIENGAFKFQWDGTGRWPQILVGVPSNTAGNELIGENGTYTVHAEIKPLSPKDAGLGDINITANGFVDGVHKGPSGLLYMGAKSPVADEWFTIEGSKSTWDNDTDGIDNDDINKITTVFNYSATTGTPGGMFLMDNIKLYWKPSNVDVTIEGGVNEAFEAVELKDVSTSATVADIIAMIPNSTTEYGKITGLADENGNKITTFSAITDVTLQPLWTPWVVLDGGQEFAVEAKGVYGGGSGQWSGSYGNQNEVGNGGGQVTAAISWMYGNGWYTKNGNLYRVQDTVAIGENNKGAANDPAIWATPAVHSNEANGTLRDNIITTLAADNDAEYVLVKYRYTNLPDLAEVAANDSNPEGYKYTLSANGEELTYYDRTGVAQTFDMSPEYGAKYYIQRQTGSYSYGGGEQFRKNELFVEGEWLCDFLPFTADMKTEGVKQVIIQRYNLFDQMVTEYDYVRFVKLGEEQAPIVPEEPEQPEPEKPDATVESEDVVDVRLVSEDHSKNGVRFKAAVNKSADEQATDIGFVVAVLDKVEAAGDTEYDVTVDATDYTVAVGYKREETVDKVSYLDSSTDDALEMTGVLIGVGAPNYDREVVARPFIKVGDTYTYGEPIITSLYDELAKLYFVDPTDPEASDLTEWFNDLYETDVDLAYYIEDIIYEVNGWN